MDLLGHTSQISNEVYGGGGQGTPCLPYKTLFPPGIKLYNPPNFLVVRDRFARIYKEARGAVYQIREIPITGAKPPNNFRQDEVI